MLNFSGSLSLEQMNPRKSAVALDSDCCDSIVPFADGIITYYGQHWPNGADGKTKCHLLNP